METQNRFKWKVWYFFIVAIFCCRLVRFYVQSAKFSNVSHSQITMMVNRCLFDPLISSGLLPYWYIWIWYELGGIDWFLHNYFDFLEMVFIVLNSLCSLLRFFFFFLLMCNLFERKQYYKWKWQDHFYKFSNPCNLSKLQLTTEKLNTWMPIFLDCRMLRIRNVALSPQ